MQVGFFTAASGQICDMALVSINIGRYALDCTGFPLRLAIIDTNAMFAELFGLLALSHPQVISIGTYAAGTNPNDLTNPAITPGDTALVFCTKMNANFTALFAAIGQPTLRGAILLGGEVGMIIGENAPIIGTGDPGRTIWYKVNANFGYLYAQVGSGINLFAWTTESGAYWTTETSAIWTTQ